MVGCKSQIRAVLHYESRALHAMLWQAVKVALLVMWGNGMGLEDLHTDCSSRQVIHSKSANSYSVPGNCPLLTISQQLNACDLLPDEMLLFTFMSIHCMHDKQGCAYLVRGQGMCLACILCKEILSLCLVL